jgi:hypothetical protein
MKRFLSLIMIMMLAGVIAVGCKSSSGPTAGDTHGVDAAGNVWMNAPPTGEGLQMAIQPFDVPADSEVQGDFYLHLPSDLPFDVGRIEIAMNEGTHHMNMYRSKVAWPPDSGVNRTMVFTHLSGKVDTQTIKYQPEFNATIVTNGGDLLVEAQIPYLNWTLPVLSNGNQSVVHFGANDTLVIENHYVSATTVGGVLQQSTPNGKGKFIINLWKATSAATEPASMMFAKQPNLSLPPGKVTDVSKNCYFPGVTPNLYPLQILGMTGHFHALGKWFRVDKMKALVDANGNVRDTTLQQGIYQSASWTEPQFTVYDPPIQLNAGEYLSYTAEYFNNTAVTVLFGAHVRTQEHCNLFSWFVPAWNNGETVYDFNP